MQLGYSSMNTPDDIRPDVLARALEERGYESLWIGEHSHIPVSQRTPYPAGGPLPDAYRRMMDPFVSLTMAATSTTRLRVGTGVALALEHHVLELAKSVATLDLLSGGRLLFGVGVGWNKEELANHSTIPWSQRYRGLEDCVRALRRLWTDDEAEHHGQFFDFDAVWSYPKPVQRPHLPVLCGVAGRVGTSHAIRWADGWMPMDAVLGNVARRIARFREAAAEAGRDDIPITIVTYGDPTPDTLHHYRELGVVRAVVGGARPNWDDPTTAMAYIDRIAPLVDELR
jgi:probable F420-dependent oxidoreductase